MKEFCISSVYLFIQKHLDSQWFTRFNKLCHVRVNILSVWPSDRLAVCAQSQTSMTHLKTDWKVHLQTCKPRPGLSAFRTSIVPAVRFSPNSITSTLSAFPFCLIKRFALRNSIHQHFHFQLISPLKFDLRNSLTIYLLSFLQISLKIDVWWLMR